MAEIQTNEVIRKTCGSAVASAACGILSCVIFGVLSNHPNPDQLILMGVVLVIVAVMLSFYALLLGGVALRMINQNKESLKGYRYVIIGFVFAAFPFFKTIYWLVKGVITNLV